MKEAKAGGLVDFIENLLFEEYKDQPLHGAVRFKRTIKENYKFVASSDLYVRLVNYQIKKYGEPLVPGKSISYVKSPESKSPKTRICDRARANAQYELQKFMERVYGSKRAKEIIKGEDTESDSE